MRNTGAYPGFTFYASVDSASPTEIRLVTEAFAERVYERWRYTAAMHVLRFLGMMFKTRLPLAFEARYSA